MALLLRFQSLGSLLLLLLLQMHAQVTFGFLAPASPRRPGNLAHAAGVSRNSANRPPPATARSVAAAATAAAAEAETTSGASANGAGTRTGPEDDSTGARAEATAAGEGHDPSSVRSEFQEFVERRKSGARRVMLDLRPAEDFRREHLKGSTSIPVDELEPRLLELPPPFAQPVSIVGNQEVRAQHVELMSSACGRMNSLTWSIVQSRVRPSRFCGT